jgi:hypothetical protein
MNEFSSEEVAASDREIVEQYRRRRLEREARRLMNMEELVEICRLERATEMKAREDFSERQTKRVQKSIASSLLITQMKYAHRELTEQANVTRQNRDHLVRNWNTRGILSACSPSSSAVAQERSQSRMLSIETCKNTAEHALGIKTARAARVPKKK